MITEISPEILQGFYEQAETSLPLIRGAILVCARDGNLYGELDAALRQAAALRDAAMIVDLPEAARIAEDFAARLATHAALKSNLTDEQSRRLLDQLAALEAAVAETHFAGEEFNLSVSELIEESFDNLFIKPNTAEKIIDVEPQIAAPEEFLPVAFEESEIIEIDADEWGEEFEIDEEMLEIFALEAEELLKSISDNLEILEKQPNNRNSLMEIRRNAHTLKGSAGIVGLKDLSAVAHRVEDLLDYLAENEVESSEKVFELLLTAADCCAALAHNETSAQLTKKISRLYENFDALLASLTGKSAAAPPPNDEIIVPTPLEIVADVKIETADEKTFVPPIIPPDEVLPSVHAAQSVVRVSLEKLDDLFKIVNDVIFCRSMFEERLGELETQIGELYNNTRRLQNSTGKLETEFEADLLGQASVFQSQSINNLFDNADFPADFDALEFDRYTEFHQTAREIAEVSGDASAINLELDNLRGNLSLLFENQKHLIDEMHDKILRLRLVSFGSLAVRLQRTVRVTCDEENKIAELVIEGEDAEIDTQILDSLIEPLLHLLRNAVAHGIEPPELRRLLGKPEAGKIVLRVHNEGTHIILEISDDGRGISAAALKEKALMQRFVSETEVDRMSDAEAFALIFQTGLTTADKISQVAGRGVGMNIVKNGIERKNGTIQIKSEPQKGTTFTVRLPMALAATRAIYVKADNQIFAFPTKFITRISEHADGAETPVYSLAKILGLPAPPSKNVANPIIYLKINGGEYALQVDEIIKTEEIIVKPLGSLLSNLKNYLGASFLGNGRLIPVLDLNFLLADYISKISRADDAPPEIIEDRIPPSGERLPLKIMIVDDSPSVRHLTSKVIKNAGWTASVAKDGLDALDVLQSADELPDVILTDVEMPRMDGYELLASLKQRENLREIPVVMVTSRAGDKHRQKAFKLGAAEYLAKPFDDEKLIKIIGSFS